MKGYIDMVKSEKKNSIISYLCTIYFKSIDSFHISFRLLSNSWLRFPEFLSILVTPENSYVKEISEDFHHLSYGECYFVFLIIASVACFLVFLEA